MFKQQRLTVLSMAVLLALMFAAAMPISALAQGEVPPVDAPAVEEVVPPVEEPLTVPEVLDQLPVETDLVVLDQNGETLPLASVEAADVLASGDPYFWDGLLEEWIGYTFIDGTCPDFIDLLNCNEDDHPIQAAVNAFKGNDNAFGNIYVEAGDYNENVLIDGGGNLVHLTGLIGDGSGSTSINGSLNVFSSNAFMLQGFTIKDWVSIESTDNVALSDVVVDGTESDGGLDIFADGSVTLDSVESFNSSDAGATVLAFGDVTVSNSSFHENTLDGLTVSALSGNVTLNNVTATWNGSESGNGATVTTVLGNITVNGGNFSENAGVGLLMESDGLGSDRSSGNTGPIGSQPTPTNYTVNGGNFNDNYYNGLYVNNFTGGDVTLNNVTALRNGVEPTSVLLLGPAGGGGGGGSGAFVMMDPSGAGNINVTCGNYSNNGAYGLELLSMGNVNLAGPTLTGNGYAPYYVFEGATLSFTECGGEDGPHGFKAQNNLVPLIPLTSSAAQVCDGEKKVVLKAGEAFGAYENLCDVEFQLKDVAEDALPGALPSGATQLGSLEAQVTSGGNALGELPVGGKITLKFPIPAGTDEASLSVLFWNGTAWVEVAGGQVIDGFYVVTVEKPGNYVLATQ